MTCPPKIRATWGVSVSVHDVLRLKELTTENVRLKRLLAERNLEVDALKELLAKKMVSMDLRRAVSFLKARGLSECRSCVLIGLSKSGFRYQAHPRDDSDLAERLRQIARRRKRYGYRRALGIMWLQKSFTTKLHSLIQAQHAQD